ncbi:MAG: hypothetical protein GQ535_09100 [Rhodobacteraceae bacterium]|nr:hypothetical protein [Paracoccaceae bacterium]
MRFVAPAIFTASLFYGQIVAASPREDAEFITQSIGVTFEGGTLLESIASTYADFLTEELGRHSVRVTDSARFEKLLPVEALEPWRMRWQEIFTKRLVDNYTPDDLARMVNGAQTLYDEPEGDHSFASDAAFYFFSASVGFHIGSQTTVIYELKSSAPTLLNTPFMADILETDGVFSFPNPIWRRDLIAQIRRGP